MNKSVVTAAAILLVLALWMLSGLIPGSSKADQPAENEDSASTRAESSAAGNAENGEAADSGRELMKVQVANTTSDERVREITLQGQLDPGRRLHLVAQTSGAVESIPVSRGSRVKSGDILVKLTLDSRDSDLREANAHVAAARAEQKAAARLQKRGLQSELALQQANAALASAIAGRDRIARDIEHTEIRAPFDAILNDLTVDEGELVQRGATIADLIDDSKFVISATATQQTINQISSGQSIRAKLITGEEVEGKITFLSQVADPQTRSFVVEAEINNPPDNLSSGVSASLLVPVESIAAVQVSASAMALGDDGEIGVKLVNDENLVEFYPVQIVSTDQDGAWVTGIPAGSRVITLGQGFVTAGEEVEPVEIDDAPAPN